MATILPPNKNSASLTLPFRHGKAPTLQDVQNLTFNDPLLNDGTLVKDTTFNQLADATWTSPNKNSATITPTNKN